MVVSCKSHEICVDSISGYDPAIFVVSLVPLESQVSQVALVSGEPMVSQVPLVSVPGVSGGAFGVWVSQSPPPPPQYL